MVNCKHFLTVSEQNYKTDSMLWIQGANDIQIYNAIKMEANKANLENDTFQFLPLALVFPSAVACFIIFNLPGPNFSHKVEKHL